MKELNKITLIIFVDILIFTNIYFVTLLIEKKYGVPKSLNLVSLGLFLIFFFGFIIFNSIRKSRVRATTWSLFIVLIVHIVIYYFPWFYYLIFG
jgi:VIT1/CCC1 family predicted Fe2+/Mn2+ transporter